MKDFYVTLLSDSCMNTFRNNKQSNFTVKLDHQIQISEDEWEVSLAEIITPVETLTISEGNNFFFLAFPNHGVLKGYDIELNSDVCTYANACDEYKLVIPSGHYTSHGLVEEIQSSIDSFEDGLLKRANAHIVVDYNQNSKRLKITAQNDKQVRLKFPNDFGQILGINPLWSEKSIGNEKDVFTYSVDLNGPYDRLYVYSDVAAFTNVGDTQAPILRILPFEPNQTLTNFHMEFRNLHYVPVAKSFIDQIHISIKGDNGEDVPFVTGKTMIKLHFRLKNRRKIVV